MVIIGDFIAVDRFNHNRKIEYFFLTHAHSDHYGRLNHKWKSKIHCSTLTASLLPVVTDSSHRGNGVDSSLIHSLELHRPHLMNGFTVTLIEANHAPGSVMFLFEGQRIPGGSVLCTGDFRADTDFYSDLVTVFILQKRMIDSIYVDNTYDEVATKEFPCKKKSLKEAENVIDNLISFGVESISIAVPKIGREQFLRDLQNRLQMKVKLNAIRQRVADALDLSDSFAEPYEETLLRTCSKNEIVKILDENQHVIDPTMLRHLKPGMKHLNHDNYHQIDYSDHCSPNELRDFLSLLSFSEPFGNPHTLNPKQTSEFKSLSLMKDGMDSECEWDATIECLQECSSVINDDATQLRIVIAQDYAEAEFEKGLCSLMCSEEIMDVDENNVIDAESMINEINESLNLESTLPELCSPSSNEPVSKIFKNNIWQVMSEMTAHEFDEYRKQNQQYQRSTESHRQMVTKTIEPVVSLNNKYSIDVLRKFLNDIGYF